MQSRKQKREQQEQKAETFCAFLSRHTKLILFCCWKFAPRTKIFTGCQVWNYIH